jgi:hypothetical protein
VKGNFSGGKFALRVLVSMNRQLSRVFCFPWEKKNCTRERERGREEPGCVTVVHGGGWQIPSGGGGEEDGAVFFEEDQSQAEVRMHSDTAARCTQNS